MMTPEQYEAARAEMETRHGQKSALHAMLKDQITQARIDEKLGTPLDSDWYGRITVAKRHAKRRRDEIRSALGRLNREYKRHLNDQNKLVSRVKGAASVCAAESLLGVLENFPELNQPVRGLIEDPDRRAALVASMAKVIRRSIRSIQAQEVSA